MIKSLKVSNLRCFTKEDFVFDDKVNLLIGQNGTGKTTILESIAFFTFGKFRSIAQDNLAIKEGSDNARFEVVINQGRKEIKAAVALTREEKIVQIEGKKTSLSKVVGLEKIVFFNPETIDLVSGSPSTRRSELDLIISEQEAEYVKTHLQYRRVLHNRNHLLKMINQGRCQEKDLEFWNRELIRLGSEIYNRRLAVMEIINKDLNKTHQQFLLKDSDLRIQYQSSLDYERFEEELFGSLSKDLRLEQTTAGPHRDDFVFIDGKKKLKDGASRGEQRLAAAAFKMQSKHYLESLGFQPVLIFDDIFSELDELRRGAVGTIIEGEQVIMSATDEKVISKDLKDKATPIYLSNG